MRRKGVIECKNVGGVQQRSGNDLSNREQSRSNQIKGMKSKELVIDNPTKIIKQIGFGVLNPSDIQAQAEIECFSRDLYSQQERKPVSGGVLDRRMGTSQKDALCDTCNQKLVDCAGHWGFIRLCLPVFHAGFFKSTLSVLQQICKSCSRVMLTEAERRLYLKKLRNPALDNPQKMAILKAISSLCKKVHSCHYCGSTNGTVKKTGVLRLVHEKYKMKSKAKEYEEEKMQFQSNFSKVIEESPEYKAHIAKAQDDLTPLKVFDIFTRVSAEDCELLGLNPISGRPEMFLWTFIPVPPVCIRPSVAMDKGDAGSNEDDLTVKLAEAITLNMLIQKALEDGDTSHRVSEDWELMQLTLAQLVNSEMPGLSAATQSTKWIRGICQRLKGKQGRFRGNLSGKRVDFSARTVISPDPNLRIDQVAVPDLVAKILTYPEIVTPHNIEKLRQRIINGADIHPGANYVQQTGRPKRFLKFVADRHALAKELKVGDEVERHLDDGDVVLFNRQPSLHKLSIMSLHAKVRPWKTFRFNECVCTPFNADFDGDEMNLHVPQTEEARSEAVVLMGTKNNLVTPRNGQPLIAATQDFITGSYLITRKDTFFTKDEFVQVCCMMFDAQERIDLPPPVIIKPVKLWTGKQIFNILMRPNKKSNVLINLETKNKSFYKDPSIPVYKCPNDGWLVIQNSELLSGVVDKSIVGDGNKDSIFYVALRDYGPIEAANCMNRIAKLCARFMANRGFSIGIEDVTPGDRLQVKRDQVIGQGYTECDGFINEYKNGTLKCQAGCNEDQTLEASISGKLSKIRDDLGQICLHELNKHNSPLIMSVCGSKGSKINVCQMIACVGQQIISGSRIADGFDCRTLPHFDVNSRTPAAKGFVKNSFYTGLSPSEFIFHAASGREGLVDTAVKTAETGYMQRRLMKALEDLSVQYDYSVRSSIGQMFQFEYGNDSLDPTNMETDAPVDFKKNWTSTLNMIPFDPKDVALNEQQMLQYIQNYIQSQSFIQSCSSAFGMSILKFAQDMVNANAKKLKTDFEFDIYEKITRVTQKQLDKFLELCKRKYQFAKIEPGTAVGALAAQSIGEPGTQMTLKTFHFAGVASMSITLGVPRIKEIINASKVIKTPIITAKLVKEDSEAVARIVKGRIEATKLGGVLEYIEEVISSDNQCYLQLKIDWDAIKQLQLEVDANSICKSIVKAPKLKIQAEDIQLNSKGFIRIYPSPQKNSTSPFYDLQRLKRMIKDVIIVGIPSVSRAVINEQEGKAGYYDLLAEGYGLREVMTTDGVIGTQSTSNHINEVEKVLGIEAARQTIIQQIQYTMSSHGMTIDTRHVMLLADIMTFKGEVLGITRFGIAKMKDSVLMLASFEKTTDHLFDASMYGKVDSIEGVSECIIMGIPMSVGTGSFKILQQIDVASTAENQETSKNKRQKQKKESSKQQQLSCQFVNRPLLFDLSHYHPSLFS